MMRCACVDIDGISDLPVRLLIAAVLTSLVIPVFWSAYSDLSATITEGAVGSEMDKLVSSVRDVMGGGVGSRTEVYLDLQGWGNCDIERIEVGGPPNDGSSRCYLIRIDIGGRAQTRIAPEPLTKMTTEEGGSLVLKEGLHHLSVTHAVMGSDHVAVLAVM